MLADLNGDGVLDVAVANSGSGTVSVLLGNGNGTLGAATNYTVGSDPVALAAPTVSGTDYTDLAIINHSSNNETILSNNGSGGFTATQTIALGESGDSVALGNFNNTGIPQEVGDGLPYTFPLIALGAVPGGISAPGRAVTYEEGGVVKLVQAKNLPALAPDIRKLMPSTWHLEVALELSVTSAEFMKGVQFILLKLVTQRYGEINFKSKTQLINYAILLEYTILFSNQLMANAPKFPDNSSYAEFPGSKYWTADAEVKMADGKTVPGLMLNGKGTPAQGIEEFFGTNGKKAVLDCTTFSSLVARRALIEVIGTKLFNDKYKNIPLGSMNVVGDPYPFVGLADTGYKTYQKLQAAGMVIPGLFVRFAYPPNTNLQKFNAYLNENTIVVGYVPSGENLFIGQPFRSVLTAEELIGIIQNKTGVEGTLPDTLSTIEFDNLPS